MNALERSWPLVVVSKRATGTAADPYYEVVLSVEQEFTVPWPPWFASGRDLCGTALPVVVTREEYAAIEVGARARYGLEIAP